MHKNNIYVLRVSMYEAKGTQVVSTDEKDAESEVSAVHFLQGHG